MPYPSFPADSPSTKWNSNDPASSKVTWVYDGGGATLGAYGIVNSVVGNTIQATTWNNLRSKISSERVRRNRTAFSYTLSTTVSATDFNRLREAVQVSGQFTNAYLSGNVTSDTAYNGTGQNQDASQGGISRPEVVTYTAAASPSMTSTDKAEGVTIYASTLNQLIADINAAGQVCVCNCNYCTCNCNYCVCNCNYRCTCNCNYSDIRLKENITLLGTEYDLNIYSFTYVWDKATTYIGVMAQELLGTKYEDALSVTKHGHYTVNYSKLPVNHKEA